MSPVVLDVQGESDIGDAIRQVKQLAGAIGFDKTQAYYIATATSELATNLLLHAGGGTLTARWLEGRLGICLETRDTGPGIPDIERAMQEGFSTAGGLGCGLPGVSRLMDELNILSTSSEGSHLRTIKWL